MKSNPVLEAIQTIVDQQSRVSFAPLSVSMPDLLLFLIFHLEKIFGSLETNLYANGKFGESMKPFLKGQVNERMINNLEAELFGEEEIDWEAEIARMRSKTKK